MKNKIFTAQEVQNFLKLDEAKQSFSQDDIGKVFWCVEYKGVLTQYKVKDILEDGAARCSMGFLVRESSDYCINDTIEYIAGSVLDLSIVKTPPFYTNYEEALKQSKKRYDEEVAPNANYKVARFFDDVWEAWESGILSKKEATDLAYKLNRSNRHYVSYSIMKVNEEVSKMKGKIFKAQEVQAIIAGNKKMFREVIRPQPTSDINRVYLKESNSWQWSTKKIFVKESFLDFKNNNSDIFYKSDFEVNNLVKTADLKWKPAQQMKQEQSRITLQIKSIWVENLSEISDEDIFAEGIEFYKHTTLFSPKEHFASYWNATHKKPEEKWEANPSVFVYNFEVVK